MGPLEAGDRVGRTRGCHTMLCASLESLSPPRVCSFPVAEVTKHHRPGGLKQQKVVLRVLEAKSKIKVLAGPCSLRRLRENPSLPLPASGAPSSPCCSLACRCITLVWPSSSLGSSPCYSLLSRVTQYHGPTLLQCDVSYCTALTRSPNNIHSEAPGRTWIWGVLLFHPVHHSILFPTDY